MRPACRAPLICALNRVTDTTTGDNNKALEFNAPLLRGHFVIVPSLLGEIQR